LRLDRSAHPKASIGSSDRDSDDGEVLALQHLLEAEAPQSLSAVAELLIEEDAGYEVRMESLELRDHGLAASVYAAILWQMLNRLPPPGPSPKRHPSSCGGRSLT
jgi:hypothetical protein